MNGGGLIFDVLSNESFDMPRRMPDQKFYGANGLIRRFLSFVSLGWRMTKQRVSSHCA